MLPRSLTLLFALCVELAASFSVPVNDAAKIYGRVAQEGAAGKLLKKRNRFSVVDFCERINSVKFRPVSSSSHSLPESLNQETAPRRVAQLTWELMADWKGDMSRNEFEQKVADLVEMGFDAYYEKLCSSVNSLVEETETPGKKECVNSGEKRVKLLNLQERFETALDPEEEEDQWVGWAPIPELINGRLAMFFFATGLLTELWTGESIPSQIRTMLEITGLVPRSLL
uniref:Uncharacterized protein n=1 Tax=Chromera velia CCMP2878 TaxID=1169474 RepID=A0A0G4FPC2_9ALVE|mmetsp:Transcript_47242/g.93206  ORF Transcript_47242/g.93206 Transcript_47242/m.93206 type:complete len:228 (-) Transcript_47242:1100-1783(-)|eukprot:Cvel_18079.t1-p1 / transcript=Cvel_18079.t1 / gene=Cvel_18079 / organism=Chromera_velia_CCMP2878 / gene_product=hypothetical protein / transcript_product=hypothetical protein / location=Cvel_scaffold1479:2526-4429(-) / protein_length=227 / sequence_SO=supercontig / SO=protein_coding / is_pseudo=false